MPGVKYVLLGRHGNNFDNDFLKKETSLSIDISMINDVFLVLKKETFFTRILHRIKYPCHSLFRLVQIGRKALFYKQKIFARKVSFSMIKILSSISNASSSKHNLVWKVRFTSSSFQTIFVTFLSLLSNSSNLNIYSERFSKKIRVMRLVIGCNRPL